MSFRGADRQMLLSDRARQTASLYAKLNSPAAVSRFKTNRQIWEWYQCTHLTHRKKTNMYISPNDQLFLYYLNTVLTCLCKSISFSQVLQYQVEIKLWPWCIYKNYLLLIYYKCQFCQVILKWISSTKIWGESQACTLCF